MGSALHYSAACGCDEAVDLLLQMGADVNARNQR
jgi:ankyrin repeat protein